VRHQKSDWWNAKWSRESCNIAENCATGRSQREPEGPTGNDRGRPGATGADREPGTPGAPTGAHRHKPGRTRPLSPPRSFLSPSSSRWRNHQVKVGPRHKRHFRGHGVISLAPLRHPAAFPRHRNIFFSLSLSLAVGNLFNAGHDWSFLQSVTSSSLSPPTPLTNPTYSINAIISNRCRFTLVISQLWPELVGSIPVSFPRTFPWIKHHIGEEGEGIKKKLQCNNPSVLIGQLKPMHSQRHRRPISIQLQLTQSENINRIRIVRTQWINASFWRNYCSSPGMTHHQKKEEKEKKTRRNQFHKSFSTERFQRPFPLQQWINRTRCKFRPTSTQLQKWNQTQQQQKLEQKTKQKKTPTLISAIHWEISFY